MPEPLTTAHRTGLQKKYRHAALQGEQFAPRQAGMTLIELIIAIVIISVGLAGVLSVYSTTVKSSADPMVRKQMLAVAEELLNEINLKSYAPLSNAAPAACARNTWNDSLDYNFDSATCGGGAKIYTSEGNAIPELNGYSVAVSVTTAAPNWQGVPAQKIRIVVTSPGGAQNLELISWRTEWGV